MVLRDRFDALFEHNVDGVFFMTLDEPIVWHGGDHDALLQYSFEHSRVTEVNAAMCEQMGATRDELIGSTPSTRWGDNGPIWKERMRELYEHGRAYQSVRAPRNDGTWIYVEGQYVCTYDEQGRITGHFGTQRDITEKRKAIDRLERALIGGGLGVWDLDLVTKELYFDEHWIAGLGYAAASAEVRTAAFWGTVMHPSDLDDLRRKFGDHLAGKTEVFRTEHRIRTAQGEWVWFLSTGKASRDSDGTPVRLVGTSVDITERKLLQDRLFLAERMASIGTLAAGVGHEINNPLTYIVLNLTLMERELRNAELPSSTRARLTNMIDQARYGTERVSSVVRDLQALTRGPDGRAARIDLIAVLDRCLEIADHQIRHRARVIRELDAIPPVLGSEGRVVQLFLNLIVNAAQAIPVGRADRHWIKIATSTQQGCAVVQVSDSGVGIAPETLGRIFDPFYTTKEVGEGTGLGLAICRSIVTALGGEIVVDSTPGQGATFRVTLPAAPAEQPTLEPVRSPPTSVDKKRVLVIDDEPMVGQLVAKVLAGHDVVSETSGRAALARLAADTRFDLILCDVMMPEVSGIEFYAQLAPELRCRVVFLSGGAFTERAQSFLDSVPNRRLAKPFDLDALTAVLISPGDHDALP